jgi:hypothetical protein
MTRRSPLAHRLSKRKLPSIFNPLAIGHLCSWQSICAVNPDWIYLFSLWSMLAEHQLSMLDHLMIDGKQPSLGQAPFSDAKTLRVKT